MSGESQPQPKPSTSVNNETIIKFKNPEQGEIPLIMIHGGGGHVYDLARMSEKFTTGFWAIQVTSETPIHSLVDQTDFYFPEIKEHQPEGPYRIGAYSAGTFHALRIAILLQDGGDQVVQLALLDQFPLVYLAPPQPLQVAERGAYVSQALYKLADSFRRDSLPRRQKLAREMEDAFEGRPSSELGRLLARMLQVTMDTAMDFIRSLRKTEGGDAFQDLKACLVEWLQQIKAPVTLYVASGGFQTNFPNTEEWKDLGVRQAFPEARVVNVDGNHFEIVENDIVCHDLQSLALS